MEDFDKMTIFRLISMNFDSFLIKISTKRLKMDQIPLQILQYVEIILINHGNNIGCLDRFNWYASTSDRVLTWDMEWKDHLKTVTAPEYVHLYKLPTS